ncbi:MAG: mechanosensitive ion channel domain-containing protein [Phormidesmis sp.]
MLWVLLFLCLSGIFSPSHHAALYAAEPSVPAARANVVVDGRPIFPLTPAGSFSAQQRVSQANRQIAMLANANSSVNVEVVERNQQLTIVANDQYLLTVTDSDTTPDKTTLEQAEEWTNLLEASLDQARRDRQPAEVRSATIRASLALFLTLLLHWGLGYFWRGRLKQTIRQAVPSIPQTGMPGSQDFHFLLNLKLTLVRLVLWVSTAWYVSSLFPLLRQRRYDLLNRSAGSIRAPLLSLGGESYTLADLLILMGLLWGLFTLIQLSAQLLQNQILRRTQLERGSKEIIAQTYRYGSFVLGTLILLQAWGIDLRSVALLGSALGIGIGLGLQEIARNFGSGLVLLFERSIQVGDFIELEAHMGIVERIGVRSMTLRTLDNISVLVPNSLLIESQVMNWNHDHPVSRLHLTVAVAYGSDAKQVKQVLMQVAAEHEQVLPKPAPDVYLKNYGDNAIDFDLMIWIRRPELQLKICSDLYFRIEEMFDHYDITIPFPQRDLHLRSGTLPLTFPPEITEALLKMLKHKDMPDSNRSSKS